MIVNISGRTHDEVWFKLLCELCEHGRVYKIDEGSYKGDFRLEFDLVVGEITEPVRYTDSGVRLPLAVTAPEGCPVPTTDKDIEDYFTNYLMDGNKEINEDYRYSTFLVGGEYSIPSFQEKYRQSPIINKAVIVPNQLQWCIDHYKQKGFFNNHCVIQIGYPESNLAYNFKYSNENERRTSPCLRLIDTKIIKKGNEYYLNFFSYFRSQDAYNGFPTNYGGIALLQEYMANELGVKIGSLSFGSKGLHVYGHAISALIPKVGALSNTDRMEELKQLLKEKKETKE
jgi:thymidylate synthase